MVSESVPDVEDIVLPADLEQRTNEQFDEMVRIKRIFYDEQTEPGEVFVDNGFLFEFRIVPILKRKPILAPDDPGRGHSPAPTGSTPKSSAASVTSSSSDELVSTTAVAVLKGPFVNPDPAEIILDDVGPKHRLMLNKFCLYRPMLVLPTKEFALQSDDLDKDDIAATWALVNAYQGFEPLVIYNRGVNGGSSQGHKHLQLFPVPPLKPFYGRADSLWPAKATSSTEVADRIPGVPFKHFVLRIPPHTRTRELVEMYQRLLELTRQAHVDAGGSADDDYNVTLTKQWIAVIPRTTVGPADGPFGTSTVGMLGIPGLRDVADREMWNEFGNAKYLARLGIPI